MSHIGIIGGAGKTGGQFASLLTKRGYKVSVTGADNADQNKKLFAECDTIIFAVPLAHSVDIMKEEIVHATRKDQLIMDLSSLKVPQVNVLLKGAGEVIGLHPLFGPWTQPHGETIVLCPARCKRQTLVGVIELFQAMDMKTKIMTAKEHDQLMAILQVLPHVKNLIVADTLQKLDADIQEVFSTCSPVYELELNAIGRFLDDTPELYGSIILDNPDTLEVLESLQETIGECIDIAKKRDLKRFSSSYKRLRNFFGGQIKDCRHRTEECISHLSQLRS